MARLEANAETFVDREPGDVIDKALDAYEQLVQTAGSGSVPTKSADPTRRIPRQRGCRVILAGKNIDAYSVKDLYQQAFNYLLQHYPEELDGAVPHPTSEKRYLVARTPIHPGGGDFFSPVSVGRYFMEAHKNYENAIRHLEKFCERLGLTLKYVS
jgi:hypothetical protein